MPDYEKLYYILFNAATGAIEAQEKQNFGAAKEILVAAQKKTEDIFISEGDDSLENTFQR